VCLLAALASFEAGSLNAQPSGRLPASQGSINQPDQIALRSVHFRDADHDDHYTILIGHGQQFWFELENMTTNRGFSQIVVTVRKIGGAGSFVHSITRGMVPPGRSTTGTGINGPHWVPEAGEHTFEIIVDTGNTLHEASTYFANNRRVIKVTATTYVEYVTRLLNPNEIAPPATVFLVAREVDPSNLCEVTYSRNSGSVKAILRYLGPRPVPDGFVGCQANVEFFPNVTMKNAWKVVDVNPGGVGPAGTSLHTRIALRIRAEDLFYPNHPSVTERDVFITITGPKGTQPSPAAPPIRIR
jgi:hypothetical protein